MSTPAELFIMLQPNNITYPSQTLIELIAFFKQNNITPGDWCQHIPQHPTPNGTIDSERLHAYLQNEVIPLTDHILTQCFMRYNFELRPELLDMFRAQLLTVPDHCLEYYFCSKIPRLIHESGVVAKLEPHHIINAFRCFADYLNYDPHNGSHKFRAQSNSIADFIESIGLEHDILLVPDYVVCTTCDEYTANYEDDNDECDDCAISSLHRSNTTTIALSDQ